MPSVFFTETGGFFCCQKFFEIFSEKQRFWVSKMKPFALLSALEVINENGELERKADILSEQTIWINTVSQTVGTR